MVLNRVATQSTNGDKHFQPEQDRFRVFASTADSSTMLSIHLGSLADKFVLLCGVADSGSKTTFQFSNGWSNYDVCVPLVR